MNINDLISTVTTTGTDQSKPKKGAGLSVIPEGTARARLVSYIELGAHETEYKGELKTAKKVRLAFELSGSKYPPRVTEEGPKPIILGTPADPKYALSLTIHEKAKYFALFNKMRAGTNAKHMLELLGDRASFLINVVHRKAKTGDAVYANLDLDSIRPAYAETVDESGDIVRTPIKVDPASSPLQAFVWAAATPEMWDSIYIPGVLEARDGKDEKSKNFLQDIIRQAKDFRTLPCYDYACGAASKASTEALDEALDEVASEDDEDLMKGIG